MRNSENTEFDSRVKTDTDETPYDVVGLARDDFTVDVVNYENKISLNAFEPRRFMYESLIYDSLFYTYTMESAYNDLRGT